MAKNYLLTYAEQLSTNIELLCQNIKEIDVLQCANHCQDANSCALDRILVGTHEGNPTLDQCTDCKSFRKK